MQSAVIYVRSATRGDESSVRNLEMQRQECRRYADQHGIEVVAIWEDAGASGLNDRHEGLLNALSLIESNGASLLLVHRADRIARSEAVARRVTRRIERAGAAALTADGQMLIAPMKGGGLCKQQ